jgi:hypothetical protein
VTIKEPSRLRITLKLLLLAAALAGFGFVPLMGLPGALWFAASELIFLPFRSRVLPADHGWPLMLMVTLVWPWFIPLFYVGVSAVVPAGRRRVLWVLGLTAAAAILCVPAIEHMASPA